MKKYFLLMASSVFTVPAASVECTSWGCTSTISVLYTNVDGAIYVGTPDDEKKANCTPVADIYFTLQPSKANTDKVYSSLLAAYMSGKTITLRIKEESSTCELSYVRLSTAD